MAPPPSESPARQSVAAASVAPVGELNAQVADATFAVRLAWSPTPATNAPPVEQVFSAYVNVPVVDLSHPSTGALSPDGVRHE